MKSEIEEHKSHCESIIELVKHPESYQESGVELINSDKVWILGAGKASVQMAKRILQESQTEVMDGIIISNTSDEKLEGIQVFEGSHPFPDAKSVSASYELLDLARRIPADETVVFCLSGGASALLCIPAGGIEIEEFSKTYKLLLESGASIHEINTVRKHLCMLKGGQLAQVLHHTNLITLAISDVPDDNLQAIGSAPTICDPSTFKDAFQVLKRFQLWDEVPHSIRIHIAKGMGGDIPDTPKPGVNDHPKHEVKILSSASLLAQKVGEYFREEGFNIWVADDAYDKDVRTVSKEICSKAISVLSKNDPVEKPAALVFFGESTVQVSGEGKGGRNQHMALTAAISLEGQHSISLLSLGTDGIDGPTDAAGALVTSFTTLQARKKKIDPESFVRNNDSYHFHQQMDTLIKTGATGNNLMDLQVVIIE